MTNVDVLVHLYQRKRRCRASARALNPTAEPAKVLISSDAWSPYICVLPRSPMVLDQSPPISKLLGRSSPRIVRRPGKACHRAKEHKCRGAVRVGSGEKRAHGTALGVAKHRRSFGTDSVHDCPQIIHSLFERSHVMPLIG